MTSPYLPSGSQYQTHSPQLRLSCDGCNTAKVKCTKARPKCSRCQNRDVDCVYSVSLRSARQKQGSFSELITTNGTLGRAATSTINGIPNSIKTKDFRSTSVPPSLVDSYSPPSSNDAPKHTLSESNFGSMIDKWDTNISETSDLTTFSEFCDFDNPVAVLSHFFDTSNSSLNDLNGQFQETSSKSSFDTPDPTSTQFPNHQGPALHFQPICCCQQNILSKLSQLTLSSYDQTGPFDRSLSENRKIITLCTSAINCLNDRHNGDFIFILTIVSLITHTIKVYDIPGSEGIKDMIDSTAESAEPTSSLPSPPSESVMQQPFSRIRLSLGSYQLDLNDEVILRKNLLDIELAKIATLIELFERKFCSFSGFEWASTGQNEPKPMVEIVAYLKGRLGHARESLKLCNPTS
ncbi:MAG: hypothetical protein LQ351_004994 [Letrouitia transgressa]|nr:MAG: hypothetical protein LQ351_004994 [Letrouitia transgressa]